LAAVMLASSPIFLFQLLQPMSDVPAAAWWTAALVLALKDGRLGALGAGIAAGMAILTRPNIVPLAAVVGLFFVLRRAGLKVRAALFTVPAAAACLVVAAINHDLYGSALSSGYEPFRSQYDVANVVPNLGRYPRWLLQTETPFICL